MGKKKKRKIAVSAVNQHIKNLMGRAYFQHLRDIKVKISLEIVIQNNASTTKIMLQQSTLGEVKENQTVLKMKM